jgi:hypothetical protein
MMNCDLLYVTEISLESIGSPSVESDAACTSLNGHSARKSAVLVLV